MKKKQSNIKTMARIQPICKACNNNWGFFDGITVFPKLVTEENKAM